MTIQLYLQGKFEYDFSVLNIESTLVGRGISLTANFEDSTEKQVDLAMSDLYMILANVSSGRGKVVTKGNRSLTDKSCTFSVTDRKGFRNEAIRLRLKWGEVTVLSSSVRFLNMFE